MFKLKPGGQNIKGLVRHKTDYVRIPIELLGAVIFSTRFYNERRSTKKGENQNCVSSTAAECVEVDQEILPLVTNG